MTIFNKRNWRRSNRFAFKVYWKQRACNRCNSDWKLHIHHIDENPCNEDEYNLEVLCVTCHISHHNKWHKYNLWKTHTEATKEKMSKISKWKPKSEQHRQSMSKSAIWRKHSQATKDKIAKARLWKIYKKD